MDESEIAFGSEERGEWLRLRLEEGRIAVSVYDSGVGVSSLTSLSMHETRQLSEWLRALMGEGGE